MFDFLLVLEAYDLWHLRVVVHPVCFLCWQELLRHVVILVSCGIVNSTWRWQRVNEFRSSLSDF